MQMRNAILSLAVPGWKLPDDVLGSRVRAFGGGGGTSVRQALDGTPPNLALPRLLFAVNALTYPAVALMVDQAVSQRRVRRGR